MIKSCEEEDELSDKIRRIRTTSTIITGIASGLLIFSVLNAFTNMLVLISFGIFLITVSSFFLKSYGKLDKDDAECKKKIHNGHTLAFGLLGTGIGLVLFSGLSKLILVGGKKKPFFIAPVLMIVALCFILTDCILRLQVVKKCDLDKKKKKNQIIGISTVAVLVLIIAVSFYFVPI